MPRRPRDLQSNVVYHVYNRRVEKLCLFDSEEAYEQFLQYIKKANSRYPVRLHAYCVMPNHWHLAVSAEQPAFVSKYVAAFSAQDARRYRTKTETTGLGHVYQGRFCAKPTEGIVSYVRLIRYIEANPVAAGLVSRAQDWPWSSLSERLTASPVLTQPGPWRLPLNWAELVNAPETQIEMLPELQGQFAAFRPSPMPFH